MKTINEYITIFLKSNIKIYDKNYQYIPKEKISQTYYKIKNWLHEKKFSQRYIGIHIDNSYLYPLIQIACMDTGVIFVPMSTTWPKKRIDQIKDIINFSKIIDEKVIKEILNSNNSQLQNRNITKFSPEIPLYVIFTSGSTGEPKGVQILRKSYENFLNWADIFFENVGNNDKLINSTHYTFDVSLMELAFLITKQLNFYTSNIGNNPLILAKEINDLQITISVTVPNNFSFLLNDRLLSEFSYKSLRVILLAGSRFPLSVWNKLNRLLPKSQVYNCYGPTESTIYATVKHMTFIESKDLDNNIVSIGKTLPNINSIIVNQNYEEVSNNKEGELLLTGVQLMDCYINRSKLTKEVLINLHGINYYRTGDIAYKNNKNEIFIVGRSDDTIKISSQRVNLSDIDNYIQQLSEVNDCATIAIEDEKTEYKLYCFVDLNTILSNKELKKKLSEILLSFQIPSKFIIVDILPQNSSGKIDKKLLEEKIKINSSL